MSLMMIYQGMNDFARNISRQSQGPSNLPPGWGGGGGGQQDSAANMLPMLLDMKKFQAAQANQLADNQLQRDQFNATQAAAQSQQDAKIAAARALSAREGIPFEIALASMDEHPGPLIQAIGDNRKNYIMDGVRYDANNNPVAETPQWADQGFVYKTKGQYVPNQAAQRAALQRAMAGSTRISNPVTITQDTLAAKLAETPAAMFRKLSDAAYDAQAGLEATQSIYEIAKQNPNLFGPGMDLKADVVKKIQAAQNFVSGGGVPDAEQQKLLSIAKAVDIRQTNSAIRKLRDIGGNDTEKEYATVKNAIPGLETSLPAHEIAYVLEKTAAEYLSGMQAYASHKIDAATKDKSLGITTTDDAMSEYRQQHPLGEQLANNLKAVMASQAAASTSVSPPPADAPIEDVVNYYKAKK